MTAHPERIFIDWNQPFLPPLAKWLAEQYCGERSIDLQDVVLVLPGGRAGRRLLELLVEEAERRRMPLVPPRIGTAGLLPELLLGVEDSRTSRLAFQLVWAEALRSNRETLEPLIPSLPEHDDLAAWIELGTEVDGVHEELSAACVEFRTMTEISSTFADFSDEERWEVLAALYDSYRSELIARDLSDPYIERSERLENGDVSVQGHVIVAGVVDLNQISRRLLALVPDSVRIVVHCSEKFADAFDEWGALEPERWTEAHVPLDRARIKIAASPRGEGEEVVSLVRSLSKSHSIDDVTIVVGDSSMAPLITEHLASAGVPVHSSGGVPVLSSAPVLFLDALARVAESLKYSDCAALVRHPDVEKWIETEIGFAPGAVIEALDSFHAKHLPEDLRSIRLWRAEERRDVGPVFGAIEDLIAPFGVDPRPLGEWIEPITSLLVSIFGATRLFRSRGRDRAVIDASEAIRDAIAELSVTGFDHPVPASTAIRFVIRALRGAIVAQESEGAALELVGWLEAPFDDASAMIVTDLREGTIPEAINAHPFLPDSLRRHANLPDNAARYARDVYRFSVICRSRREIFAVNSRLDLEGTPVLASRLLFACDDEEVVLRANALFRHDAVGSPPNARFAGLMPGDKNQFELRKPEKGLRPPLTELRVTAFKDYLECPYRFYLKHVLGLSHVTDTQREMDPLLFGTLAHEVLARFGMSEHGSSKEPETISKFLVDEVDREVRERFGRRPPPAVVVQAVQLRTRFCSFAERQAAWASEGWSIRYVEHPPEREAQRCVLDVDGAPFTLVGRFDSVDHNTRNGEWAVLDYKSGDRFETAEQAHRKGRKEKTWKNLQLPLYNLLARELGVVEENATIKLGHVVIPSEVEKTTFSIVEWSPEDIENAIERARGVIRSVREEIFWPPEKLKNSYDDFGDLLCGFVPDEEEYDYEEDDDE